MPPATKIAWKEKPGRLCKTKNPASSAGIFVCQF
jgi:hypothetical protein